ncbi:TPA: glycosyltransferase family 1 protein [Candidatus Poribacteria bacterium]|nr:glycosyltransferase family 1 protein [Candidatus Poribacteria bacterium]
MKICVVTQQVGKVYSGPGVHSNNLIRGLINDGNNVWAVAPEKQRPEDCSGFHFVGVQQPLINNNQARWFFLSLSFARAIKQLEQSQDFSIMHFTDAREALFYHPSGPALGNLNDTYSADLRPLSFYRRHFNDWLVRWAYYGINRQFERLALKRLSYILANSKYTALVAQIKYPEVASKIEVCYKGVDWRKYLPVIELRKNNSPHTPRVLFVGGNMQRKGIRTLIRAAPFIIKKLPETAFLIVGEDPAIPLYKKMAHRLGVGEYFNFLGWKSQEELITIYAQSDVFVMPSIFEAFGLVFLEAMASGLPVIGTRVGGIPEIIENNKNGLLLPPEDTFSLAEAIVKLIVDKKYWRQLSMNALESVRQYSVETMLENIYKIYNNLIQNKYLFYSDAYGKY